MEFFSGVVEEELFTDCCVGERGEEGEGEEGVEVVMHCLWVSWVNFTGRNDVRRELDLGLMGEESFGELFFSSRGGSWVAERGYDGNLNWLGRESSHRGEKPEMWRYFFYNIFSDTSLRQVGGGK